LSGRVLILPQPTFSLQNTIDQLVLSTPKDVLLAALEAAGDDPNAAAKELAGLSPANASLPAGSSSDPRSNPRLSAIGDAVSKLQFLSAPMDGFTSHLLTQIQGSKSKTFYCVAVFRAKHHSSDFQPVAHFTNLFIGSRFRSYIDAGISTRDHPASYLIMIIASAHIKPGKRIPGQPLAILPSAIGDDGVFDKDVVNQMQTETGTTPYANHVTFGDMPYSPFKPVTHGQFCFTKINVIDKFGQAVSAIDPTNLNPAPLYPVISEYNQPQPLPLAAGATVPSPNVVIKGDKPGWCRYVQLPPNLNQDSRINAVFLTRDEPTAAQPLPPWRPALEWETPIWGWMVVNYVEEGVQFFLPDGTLYREVRLGGVNGSTE
jgi:hypothetical protein